MDDARYDKGARLLEERLGETAATAFRERLSALHPEFERYVTSFIFGDVRARGVLDPRTEALCVLAALTATGEPPQLAANIRFALASGATPEEIEEVFLLMAPYTGFPAAWNALATARRVFGSAEADRG